MIEQELEITNLGTWLLDNKDKVFRFYFYKKMFTPREQKECYIDESLYENANFPFIARITNIIETPGNFMLELQEVDDPGDEEILKSHEEIKYYYLYSDLKMELHERDHPGYMNQAKKK